VKIFGFFLEAEAASSPSLIILGTFYLSFAYINLVAGTKHLLWNMGIGERVRQWVLLGLPSGSWPIAIILIVLARFGMGIVK